MRWSHGAIAALLAWSASACTGGESEDGQTSPPPAGSATISVSSSQQFQTMAGWEVTAWLEDAPGNGNDTPATQAEIISRAVHEVGIDRLRLEVRPSAERPPSAPGWDDYAAGTISNSTWRGIQYATINDDGNPNNLVAGGFDFSELDFFVTQVVLPVRQALQARGRTLFLNVCYVAFTSDNAPGSEFAHDDPAEYAEFVLAVHQHLNSVFGLRPDTWEVILEPDTGSSGAAQNWDGQKIGQLIVAASQRLQAAGFTTKFIAPSTTNMSNAPSYFDDLTAVTGALARVAELSYHRYGGVSGNALSGIASRARNNNIRASMLECWPGAGCAADQGVLRQDLVEGEASAWQNRVLHGLFNVNGSTVTLRDEVRYVRHYFDFVDRGARRIGATSSNGSFQPVAFINNPGSNEKYVVVINASGGGSFSISGLPSGDYGVQYTTGSEIARDLNDVFIGAGVALQASIPAAGVVTVYRK